mmetsp:Transcript_24986/g.99286  ORF Transcript_24986/g.99286 Transcript_24986/m.99286 type:complete len:352 (-) Transcript_24986:1092-2147(-)
MTVSAGSSSGVDERRRTAGEDGLLSAPGTRDQVGPGSNLVGHVGPTAPDGDARPEGGRRRRGLGDDIGQLLRRLDVAVFDLLLRRSTADGIHRLGAVVVVGQRIVDVLGALGGTTTTTRIMPPPQHSARRRRCQRRAETETDDPRAAEFPVLLPDVGEVRTDDADERAAQRRAVERSNRRDATRRRRALLEWWCCCCVGGGGLCIIIGALERGRDVGDVVFGAGKLHDQRLRSLCRARARAETLEDGDVLRVPHDPQQREGRVFVVVDEGAQERDDAGAAGDEQHVAAAATAPERPPARGEPRDARLDAPRRVFCRRRRTQSEELLRPVAARADPRFETVSGWHEREGVPL